jgi:hypothetical protein
VVVFPQVVTQECQPAFLCHYQWASDISFGTCCIAIDIERGRFL